MPNNPGPTVANYNEGVGHGGFIATLANAKNIYIESFNVNHPSKKIQQHNQIGAPRKQAFVADFITATATAAIEVTEGSNPVTAPVIVLIGDTFGPDPVEGLNWVVESTGETFQQGDYWKANLNLSARYNQ